MMKQWGKLALCMLLALGGIPLFQTNDAVQAAGSVPPAIASGYYHNVTLGSDWTVWTWGRNDLGQLGNGSNSGRAAPVQAQGLPPIKAIGGGVRHSMAVTMDGQVWSWGKNTDYELGDGTDVSRNLPQPVDGLNGIVAVSSGTGYHSLALKSDGTVWGWGFNKHGQLGFDSAEHQPTPIQIAGIDEVRAVAAGGYYSLALREDGSVWAWGINSSGELGDDTWTERHTPSPVLGLSGITAIAAGGSHSLALDEEGNVWTWGHGQWGQLGSGNTSNGKLPVKLPLTGIVAIAAGGYHSLALSADGNVWAWGLNNYGQLGDGTASQRNSPVAVDGVDQAIAISAGGFHSIALRNDSTVWSWGINGGGELGDGTAISRPSPVQSRAVLDITPPEAASLDIAVTDSDHEQISLTWTKATDNFTAQDQLQYRVYYSDANNINTVAEIETNGIAASGFMIDASSYSISELEEDRLYYFNIIAKDNFNHKMAYTMREASTLSTTVPVPSEPVDPPPTPTASANPAPRPTPTPAPSPDKLEQLEARVEGGSDTDESLGILPIARHTSADGKITDQLELDENAVLDLIEWLSAAKDDTARLLFPGADGLSVITQIKIEGRAASAIAQGEIDLELIINGVVLRIPAASWAGYAEDIQFEIAPVQDKGEQQSIVDSAAADSDLAESAGGEIRLIGFPADISTNLQNRPVQVTLPLPSEWLSDEQDAERLLRQMLIYIQHSDGTTEALRPALVRNDQGIPVGLQISTAAFSRFSILHAEGWGGMGETPIANADPYIFGFGDGTFRPDEAISQSQLSIMLNRLLFHGYSGTEDSDADRAVTRAELAALVSGQATAWCDEEGRASYCLPGAADPGDVAYFTDVPVDHDHYDSIGAAASLGFMQGYIDGAFRPEKLVTRAEAVTVLNRLTGRRPAADNNAAEGPFTDLPPAYWAYREIITAALPAEETTE